MATAAVISVPQQIVLQSATNISLNDRFTNLSKLEFPTMRMQMAAEHQAAAKSKRFAMQMVKRPDIKSEIDAETWNLETPTTKGSLAGRLGRPNIQNRLDLHLRGRSGRGGPWRGRGRGIMANVNGFYTTSPGYAGAVQFQGIRGARGRGARGPGRRMFSPYGGGYGIATRGNPGRGGVAGRGAIRGNWLAAGRGRGYGRGQLPFPGQRGRGRGFGAPNPNVWRSPRGVRGTQWARGTGNYTRGAGRGRGGPTAPVTQQLLDNQIDDYMSKTRLNMDNFV